MPFSIIVAMDAQRGIGKDNGLPWRLKNELAYFKRITTTVSDSSMKNAVIMGRHTWESLPASVRPLPDRVNIVVTSRSDIPTPEHREPREHREHNAFEGSATRTPFYTAPSLDVALEIGKTLHDNGEVHRLFVIGGSQLYQAAMAHPQRGEVYVTEIQNTFHCDTFFPDIRSLKVIESSDTYTENGVSYQFKVYR